MKTLTEVLKFNEYEAGVTVNARDYDNNVALIIENGKLKVKAGDRVLSKEEIDSISDYKSFLEKYIRLQELYAEEKREISKLFAKAEINEKYGFLKDWNEIKDLRTKAANKLKEKTIERLKKIAERLEKETNFSYFNFPKNIFFYDNKKDSCAGDERVKLVWTRENGYIFAVEEYSPYEGWQEINSFCDSEKTEFGSIETGDIVEFEKMSKKTIKKIAKYINSFELNITVDLNKRLNEEKTLLKTLENRG